jgi:predicted ATPase
VRPRRRHGAVRWGGTVAVSIRLLGAWAEDAWPDDEASTPAGRLFLAYALMHPARRHALTQLAAWLWPTEAPCAASRPAVARWIQRCGGVLHIEDGALIVERDAALDVDAWEFDALVAACDQHQHRDLARCPQCLARMRRALPLVRGEPLAGLAGIAAPAVLDWLQQWREATIASWRRLARAAVQAAWHAGDAAWAEVLARQVLAHDPFDSIVHQVLLRIVGTRDPAAALRHARQYHAMRRRSGLPADLVLRELAGQVRAGTLAAPARHTLPRPMRRLIGRDAERERLSAWLSTSDARIVTIVGPGGAGKTSLAMVAAGELAWSFAHGTAFVPLLDVADVDTLAYAIGRAIGHRFSGQTPPLQQIGGRLAAHEWLLVLDNLEPHAELARAIAGLLEAAPRVQVLVTARQRMNLRQERILELGGLSLEPPTAGITSDAVTFFLTCLQATDPARDWLARDGAVIGRICEVVGGLPLAIELAAAQCRRMRPATLLRRVMTRIDTLATTSLAVSERHRRIEAIFAEVWQALGPTQHLVLMAMSAFHGAFDVPAVVATLAQSRPAHDARAVRATMASLIDRGMLQPAVAGDHTLHPLLRRYTHEHLMRDAARADELERGHCAWMCQRVQRAGLRVVNPATSAAAVQLGASFDDLAHAWRALLRRGAVDGITGLIAPLAVVGVVLGWYAAIESLLGEALAVEPPLPANLRAGVLIGRGWMQWYRGEFVALHQSAQAALAAGLTDVNGLCMARVLLGVALFELGDALRAAEELDAAVDDAERAAAAPLILGEAYLWTGIAAQNIAPRDRVHHAFARSLALFRQVDDWRGIANALNGLAQLPWRYDAPVPPDEAAESLRLFEEALQLARSLGTPRTVAVLLSNVGVVSIFAGRDADAALALIDEGLAIARSIANLAVQLELLHTRAYGLIQLQRWDAARETLIMALRQAVGGGNIPRRTVIEIIEGLGTLEARRGDRERAAAMLSVVLAHPQTSLFVRTRAGTLLAQLGVPAPADRGDSDAVLGTLCAELLAAR